jgi:hypothetical protein
MMYRPLSFMPERLQVNSGIRVREAIGRAFMIADKLNRRTGDEEGVGEKESSYVPMKPGHMNDTNLCAP